MRTTLAVVCRLRGTYRKEGNDKLGKERLVVDGPVKHERKEWVVTMNDEDQSNSNSGKKATQNPQRTSRRRQQRQRRRRQQDEQVHQYSPQGIGCLFCCEKKTMAVVFLVFTSNVDARMVVNHTVEPPERMESKRYGCNLPDVPVAEIDT